MIPIVFFFFFSLSNLVVSAITLLNGLKFLFYEFDDNFTKQKTHYYHLPWLKLSWLKLLLFMHEI